MAKPGHNESAIQGTEKQNLSRRHIVFRKASRLGKACGSPKQFCSDMQALCRGKHVSIIRKHMSIILFLMIGALTHLASAEPIDFRCGARFRQQLQLPASIYWSAVPLREGLENLARTQRLAIWLDRRVVPDQPVTLSAKESTLSACFSVLANTENLDISWTDCVVYIGPENAADRFATVNRVHARLVTKLARTPRHRWQVRKGSSWPNLTTPGELVTEIEQEVGVRISGQEQIPHDLWPAGQWSSLPAYTRLGLILAGFDLTVLWNPDGSVRIVTLPERPKFQQTYRVSAAQQQTIQKLVAGFPHAKLDQTAGRAHLAASWRVHEAVRQAMEEPVRRQGHIEDTRYTLRGVNQSVGPLLEKLTQQLELTCEFSAAARHYEQRVSFEVRQVDRDELFRTILADTGLRSELQGTVLRVFLKSEVGSRKLEVGDGNEEP